VHEGEAMNVQTFVVAIPDTVQRTPPSRSGRASVGTPRAPSHGTRLQRVRAGNGSRRPRLHDPTSRIRQARRQAHVACPCSRTQRACLQARLRRPQLRQTSLRADAGLAGSGTGVISTIPSRNGRTFECDYLRFCMTSSARWRSMPTMSRKASFAPISLAGRKRRAILAKPSPATSLTQLARGCAETSSVSPCSVSCFAHTPTNHAEWTPSTRPSASFSRRSLFSPRSRLTRARRCWTNGSLSSAS